MTSLFLDTTSNKEIVVRLTIHGKSFQEKRLIENNRTQIVLPLIQQLLKEHNVTPKDIEKVMCKDGLGSFTGIRVGAAISNALIFGLGISQKLIVPIYT